MKHILNSIKVFVRLQWIDRVHTSSFVIGLTIQSFVLCLSVLDKSTNSAQAFVLATRASILTIVGITLFSAMSSVANDIRFGTFANLILSREHLYLIVFKRCAANTLVAFPTVIFPFVVASWRFGDLTIGLVLVAMTLIFWSVTCAGFQIALVLNSLSHPAKGVPWLRYIFIIVGLNLVPFAFVENLSKALPFYWIIHLSEDSVLSNALMALVTSLLWTFVAWLSLARRTRRILEDLQTKNRLRLA
jgi:hypothetical protein